jgi:diguanylate cyclase (GGDEF)-like protein
MTQSLVDLVEPTPYQRKTNPGELRGLYRKEGEATRRNSARQGLWLAVGAYLSFSVIDLLLLPDVALHVIAARFAIGITVLVALEIVYHTDTGTEWLDLTCATAIVAGYVGWLAVAVTTRHTENLSYFMVFGSTFMLGANLFFRFRFLLSVLTSSIILLAFFASLYLFPVSMPYQIALGSFYVSCFVFTSYVNWKLNRERYNVFLNALEAKIQHGEATERGKALLRLSRTDPLTGLENRRAIDEKLRENWSNWQRYGKGFVALLVDVDFFKRFNDYYGHQEGDRCLVRVADALNVMIAGKGGSIGRYGGEEFIALAPFKDERGVAALAEDIRSTVEGLAILHSHRRDGIPVVTVSVGASFTRNQTGTKLEKIIHEADRALYLAKAHGRNCARLFDPNDPESSDESENIAALLKIALEQNLVSMVYQPIQGISSGRIEGAEALMRLKMLDGTSVPPSLFIPVAERVGAILGLGRWAIRKVCEDLLVFDRVEIASVNVSPIQLKAPGFAAAVAAILGETGIAGHRLALEITEGLEMEMHSDVLRCIGDLKLLGVNIWLDDFGTGFAGLSWLRLIDFDTVKIDRSFLHDCDSEKGLAMLQDIVGLLRNRGLKILVEGVENEEQLELMRQLRIDQIQGYHVGRPVPLETFDAGPQNRRYRQDHLAKGVRKSA